MNLILKGGEFVETIVFELARLRSQGLLDDTIGLLLQYLVKGVGIDEPLMLTDPIDRMLDLSDGEPASGILAEYAQRLDSLVMVCQAAGEISEEETSLVHSYYSRLSRIVSRRPTLH